MSCTKFHLEPLLSIRNHSKTRNDYSIFAKIQVYGRIMSPGKHNTLNLSSIKFYSNNNSICNLNDIKLHSSNHISLLCENDSNNFLCSAFQLILPSLKIKKLQKFDLLFFYFFLPAAMYDVTWQLILPYIFVCIE